MSDKLPYTVNTTVTFTPDDESPENAAATIEAAIKHAKDHPTINVRFGDHEDGGVYCEVSGRDSVKQVLEAHKEAYREAGYIGGGMGGMVGR